MSTRLVKCGRTLARPSPVRLGGSQQRRVRFSIFSHREKVEKMSSPMYAWILSSRMNRKYEKVWFCLPRTLAIFSMSTVEYHDEGENGLYHKSSTVHSHQRRDTRTQLRRSPGDWRFFRVWIRISVGSVEIGGAWVLYGNGNLEMAESKRACKFEVRSFSIIIMIDVVCVVWKGGRWGFWIMTDGGGCTIRHCLRPNSDCDIRPAVSWVGKPWTKKN